MSLKHTVATGLIDMVFAQSKHGACVQYITGVSHVNTMFILFMAWISA
jgi:hypothetical protein